TLSGLFYSSEREPPADRSVDKLAVDSPGITPTSAAAAAAQPSASPLPERASPYTHRIPACRAAAVPLPAGHPSNAACPRYGRRSRCYKSRAGGLTSLSSAEPTNGDPHSFLATRQPSGFVFSNGSCRTAFRAKPHRLASLSHGAASSGHVRDERSRQKAGDNV